MPKFSICLIARNEEKTLPRLLNSLKEFKELGGEVILLDTGSSDKTAQVARDWGCNVEEVGDRFVRYVDKQMEKNINRKFSVLEGKIVKEGDKNFDFGSARNYAASLASNDMISMPDCDEIFTKLDIKEIDRHIDEGFEQLEFNFVFAHGPNGEETVKFIQCKMYDRKKMHWEGIIHEVLSGEAKRTLLPESILKIEHYQNEKTDRKGYLVGLAIDCFENPNKDRNSHYFARELMWRGYTKSAIKEFKRYLTISWWDAERSQSMIFIGDCLKSLGEEREALKWYNEAFLEHSGRREPILRLGKHFYDKKDWQKAIFYLEGALRIQYSGFYADDMSDYGDKVYGWLYVACWWAGDREKSREYFEKALELNPNNPNYQNDKIFYKSFEYKDKGIDGWMTPEELEFLYQSAKKYNRILEIGSWKGRSSDALLSGCKGEVHCVDHFKGSNDKNDETNSLGKKEDIYEEFIKNVGHYKNLKVVRNSSENAEKELADEKFEMIFIDGEHTYEAVKQDIRLWKKHCTKLICGHDYQNNWPGVMRAVDEEIGKPDGVEGSIWYKYIISYPEKSFVKLGDGEEACMRGDKGENCDGSKYYPELGEKLRDAFDYFKTRDDVEVVYFNDQKNYNKLLHRVDNDPSDFFKKIISSDKIKIYVAPEKLSEVAKLLGAEHIIVPEIDGFKSYGYILQNIERKLSNNCIVLFSAGMMAKPLIADVLKDNGSTTCLDIGSSFDPWISQTRTNQMSKEEIRSLYEEKPFISILIPTLKRPEGLKRCLDSIERLNYPKDKLQVLVEEDDPRMGVAKRLNKLFRQSNGKWIIFGSNDIEFTPECINEALKEANKNNLIAFNTGELLPDKGNICEHFMINRDYVVDELDGKIFDEDFNHCGCDNLLWSRTKFKTRCENAIVHHYHFSKGGQMDSVYELGWSEIENDRKLLTKKMEEIEWKQELKSPKKNC